MAAVNQAPPAPREPGAPGSPSSPHRAQRIAASLLDQVLLSRVRAGRLRDIGWPDGLRAIVGLAIVCFGAGIALVVLSSPLRRWLPVSASEVQGFTFPSALVWVVLFLVIFSVSLLQSAALHAVWWFRLAGTAVTAAIMLTWGVRGLDFAADARSTGVTVLAVALLILLVTRRRRARFAWWEFCAVSLLIAAPLTLGAAALSRSGLLFGYEPSAIFLAQSLLVVGMVTIPAAFAAGTAVAEITTSATLWAGKFTARYALRRTALVILLALCAVRGVQVVLEIRSLDPLRQGPLLIATSAAFALVLGLSVWGILRYWRRRGQEVAIADLPPLMSAMAMPIGAAVVSVQIPLILLSIVVAVFGSLLGPGALPVDDGTLALLSGPALIDVSGVLLGLLLVVLAARSFLRARPGAAVLYLGTGAMLVALSASFLSGGRITEVVDTTVLNLTATAVTIVLAAVLLVRRRLGGVRAAGLSSLLVLSGLFAHRDLIDDPISAVLGVSGVAFLLIGLVWTMLTGCAVANAESRAFPRPTRVLLVLANIVFATTILAMGSLIRGPDAELVTVDLKSFSDLGDRVLGTAMLVSVFVAVLMSIKGAHARFGAAAGPATGETTGVPLIARPTDTTRDAADDATGDPHDTTGAARTAGEATGDAGEGQQGRR